MLKWLGKQGFRCSRRHDGIYTVEGMPLLKTQIVITEEIDKKLFAWLSTLTDRLTEKAAKKVVTAAYGLKDTGDRLLAEAIVQAITNANKDLFKRIKEDQIMASALMELMRPEVEKYAEDYAKEYAEKRDIEHVKAMIRHGDDNAYIQLIMNMPEAEINGLRESMQ